MEHGAIVLRLHHHRHVGGGPAPEGAAGSQDGNEDQQQGEGERKTDGDRIASQNDFEPPRESTGAPGGVQSNQGHAADEQRRHEGDSEHGQRIQPGRTQGGMVTKASRKVAAEGKAIPMTDMSQAMEPKAMTER